MPFISCISVFWRIANPALPARMGLTSRRYIIRSTVVLAVLAAPPFDTCTEDGAVIRCPECSAEIDVDEDEVEEGEILSCPECESELEVSQIHPVHLNIISEDMDDDEDEEDDEEAEPGENGDVPKDEEEDDEEDDEE
jgi:alpha-aminoadipate carrier protein LysW